MSSGVMREFFVAKKRRKIAVEENLDNLKMILKATKIKTNLVLNSN